MNSIIKRYLIYVVVLLQSLFGYGPRAFALDLSTVRFEHFLIGDQLGERGGIGMIYNITQDSEGFMWFAGEHGVSRYDASEFRFYFPDYTNNLTIAGNTSYHILPAKDGHVWFATNRGLSRYNPNTDNFTNFSFSSQQSSGNSGDTAYSLAYLADGRIAVGTDNGLHVFTPETGQFQLIQHQANNINSPSSNQIRTLYMDKQGRLWIGYARNGISALQINKNRFSFEHFNIFSADERSSLQYQINSIIQTPNGDIWFGSDGAGIGRLTAANAEIKFFQTTAKPPFSLPSNVVRDMAIDHDGQLWAALDHGGLAAFDQNTQQFLTIKHHKSDPNSVNSNQLRSVFADANNDLWVGAFPNGINYFDRSKTAFKIWRSHPGGLSDDAILQIYKDSLGILWIGTENGLNAYDEQTGRFVQYFHEQGNPFSLRSNVVISITEDLVGNMWFGTWSGGLHRFDRETQKFYNYFPEADNPHSLINQHVWALVTDHNGQIWAGHSENGGLSRYRPETDDFEVFRHDPQNQNSLIYPYVWSLMVDSHNKLWVGTLGGLDIFDPNERQFTHIKADVHDPNKLSNDDIYSILEHSNGQFWIGTDGGGLNILDPLTKKISRLGAENGLKSLRIASLVEDRDGFVWAATNSGVAQIDPDSLKLKTYHRTDGLAGNNHNRNSLFSDSNGLIYIGSTEGITVFDKSKVQSLQTPPKIVITQLKLFNDVVHHTDIESPLSKSIENTKDITLDYNNTMFSLDFTALSYRSAFKNQFLYRLEGFENRWHMATDSLSATYTNLDPGNYVFRVKGANSSGIWNNEGAMLNIHVTPPIWRTWWAYLLYGITAIYSIYGIVQFQTRRMRFEIAHRKKSMQLDRMKDSFLASTSHELKTPLNGIIGISQALAADHWVKQLPEVQSQLNTISASGQRLASLMDDLLDFSKLSNDQLILQFDKVDIYPVIEQCIKILDPQIKPKPLLVHNTIVANRFIAIADKTRIKQIFLHLIENAVKYTNAGVVEISAETLENNVLIRVKDSGIGIPPEAQDAIFSAFNQLGEADTRSHSGTGIGLAITQKLIKLHRGSIRVTSQVGSGSTFEVTLPASPTHYLTEDPLTPTINADATNTNQHILVVDDDAVNRLVIAAMLKRKSVTIHEAATGAEALRLLRHYHKIDLVILDIMMPEMSGIEVCKTMRNELKLSTPILFLTAKRAEDAKAEALAAGGNGYLSKPVDKTELFAQIQALQSNTITG